MWHEIHRISCTSGVCVYIYRSSLKLELKPTTKDIIFLYFTLLNMIPRSLASNKVGIILHLVYLFLITISCIATPNYNISTDELASPLGFQEPHHFRSTKCANTQLDPQVTCLLLALHHMQRTTFASDIARAWASPVPLQEKSVAYLSS